MYRQEINTTITVVFSKLLGIIPPSLLHKLASEEEKEYRTTSRLTPMGLWGSQVQILSPRPMVLQLFNYIWRFKIIS
jgi:hypothetical protein